VSALALVVPFEELAPVVDDLRERTCDSKPSHGMPPHVTLLVPAPCAADAISGVLAPFSAFDVAFARLDRFPGVLWLAPEPAEPFRRMIEALVQQFPDQPPYGGAFAEIVPHLTIAQSGLEEAAETVQTRLPLRARAERAALLEQTQPDRWREIASFELGET
jgi:2'-5' RNA ligase